MRKENKSRKPKLRFPEFTDDWEQRKFDDILKVYPFKPYLKEPETDGVYEVIQQGNEPIVGYADGKPFIEYEKVVLFGDHTVSLYKPQRPFFVATDGVKIVGTNQDFDGDFLNSVLEKYKPEPEGYKRHFSILKNQDMFFTKNAEEQKKIGSFFMELDNLITLHQRECDNLEKQKKAAMQKIFSQEVRFKREDGTDYPEWGGNSFANVLAPLNNNTFSRDMLSENGTVLNIHYGDILVKFGEVCDVLTIDIPKVNADIDTSKYDVLQDGDIILADTAEDETVGKAIEIYHTGTSKVVSGLHTMACRPNNKYAPKYMGYYINSPTYHNQLFPFMQGIKVTSISRKNIADTVIYYPTDLEEQQKIADFLSAYDEAISYAKQELDKWKELKKGLLQQMFV
ncbi:MAG: restriction endonuclease subunit S [Lachnospiraceae bacterium]|nr:restriction endonuclease subunit S [Lachnospiraceae bacterium]